jgi:Flp pilus assembly CpaF family ATPase
MQSEINVLIAGNTGSGKTTLLNSLFSFVPLDERIIITEETPEINIPHNHRVCLKINAEQKITMTDLIKTTLRMRPDRVIVGEIRTKEEVDAYLDTILAGQGKGSYATFHGLSVNETLSRLKNLGLTEQDLNALDLIILQKRWTSIKDGKKIEKRKLFEIAEVENSKVTVLYRYNALKNNFEQINESRKVKEKIELVFGKKYSVLTKELRDYFEFLLLDKELTIDEFSKMFNSYILSG